MPSESLTTTSMLLATSSVSLAMPSVALVPQKLAACQAGRHAGSSLSSSPSLTITYTALNDSPPWLFVVD
jgi:hypothetical protein